MKKSMLLDKLDKATDRAVHIAVSKGMPINLSKKSTLIGNLLIDKSKDNYFTITTLDKTVLYKDISSFDIAIIICQRHSAGEMGIVKKILALEERYFKHHADMTYYLSCLKSAKRKNDLERMYILEDKFQTSEIMAKSIKDDISIFKRIK